MEMIYDGVLVMPSSCTIMDEEEMIYVEGGKKYGYSISYLTRTGAMWKAAKILKENGWTKISCYDLAAEIYSHAFAFYNAGGFLLTLSKMGIGKANDMLKSLTNGIDVENGLDTKKFQGIPRYKIFKNLFVTAPC